MSKYQLEITVNRTYAIVRDAFSIRDAVEAANAIQVRENEYFVWEDNEEEPAQKNTEEEKSDEKNSDHQKSDEENSNGDKSDEENSHAKKSDEEKSDGKKSDEEKSDGDKPSSLPA